MSTDLAEARGRVSIRPWRIGLLVDTSSAKQVRAAIADLSSVWGGCYMPIFDIASSQEALERLARQYDVDSLFANVTSGPVAELLRRPGWGWTGRDQWGPFAADGGLHTGLLPVHTLIGPTTDLFSVTWDREHPADLALAAIWGLGDKLGVPLSPTLDFAGPRTGPIPDGLHLAWERGSILGAAEATSLHLSANYRVQLSSEAGIHIMRPECPEDVVEFWNSRIYGAELIGLPANGAEDLLSLLLARPLPRAELRQGGDGGSSQEVVRVFGLDRASGSTVDKVESAAAKQSLQISAAQIEPRARFIFQGLRTRFTQSVRADFRSTSDSIDVALPILPLEDESNSFMSGVVGVQIEMHNVAGQDPRMTAAIPPYRQHAALLRRIAAMESIDHMRASEQGLVLGVDARRDHVRVPFAYNQDAMRLLFDDDAVTVSQSDVGRFQTRAAEKFGGPFSGLFNQPGVRAAVVLTAGHPNGVALQHLFEIVERDRGEWPEPLFSPRVSPKEYARAQVNYLLHSGLLVPTMKVHCSHCRVDRFVSADDLASTMTCEFCGEEFSLALSHSLVKPDWRYRLAAHLGASQIQALMPAFAVTSFLRQLRHVEEPPLSHVFGLQVGIGGRKVEVDVAAYLPDYDWTVVLAEVKTANRFDSNDIANLELLRQDLSAKGVRCLVLFASLKDSLSMSEVAYLRALVERSPVVKSYRGGRVPNVPFVLTGPDLSHPPMSKEHPWQWSHDYQTGVFGTALCSCERNLGLRSYQIDPSSEEPRFEYQWED